MTQVGLVHFEAVHDIVYYLDNCNLKSQDAFCNMVLGENCERCRWSDFCETIPEGTAFNMSLSKWAEHLI